MKTDRDKLKTWLYFYDTHEAEELLEDMESYLILHEDYKYPLKAVYHARVHGFSFYTARGIETTQLSENKITHFAELLSREEYLEFINLCNKPISDDGFLKAAIEQRNRVNKSIEKQEPTQEAKAKEEAE